MSLWYIWNRVLKKFRGAAVKESKIHKTSKVESGSTVVGCEFDRYSFCGYDCTILNAKIGAFTSIADNVYIGLAAHPIDWAGMSPVFYAGRDSVEKKFSEFERGETPQSIIGNDVWIGHGVYIKAGVKIGDGAVVGMGSVVTKDVEPYAVVAGVPAKHIKFRFDESARNELLNLKWWNLTDEELALHAKDIRDVEKFLEGFSK